MNRKGLGVLIFVGALIVIGILNRNGQAGDPAPTQTAGAPANKPEPAPAPAPSPEPAKPEAPPAKTEPAPAAPPPPAPEPTWQTVAKWEGTGILNTETFRTTQREWRINWEATDQNIMGLLQVMVYGENGNLVDLPVNHQGVGQNVSYVRVTPGRYYLTINSANVKYKVTVEEKR